jgi:CheY-like chemotaxis protein
MGSGSVLRGRDRDEVLLGGSADRGTPALDGLHVLAVDDEEDALAMVREVLEHAGARVTTVQSAEDALAVLDRTTPDLLLCDIGMPKTDGCELIAQVRRSSSPGVSRIPAAALTAYAGSEDRLRTLRSGFQVHLAKPIEPEELVTVVRALARGERAPERQ